LPSVLFLRGQDAFQHPASGGIVLGDVADHLAVGVDGDPLGHQVLLDHVDEVVALDVFGVAAREEAFGVEVRLAPELVDALGDQVSMGLLLAGVLEEFRGHGLRVDARGHVVVPLVAKHAHELGGERLVEKTEDGLAVAAIGGGDGALLDVAARAPAELLDVGEK